MTIPNLPTDNLYKFIALTGIFLFLFAIIYPEYRRQEISNEMTLIDGEISKLDLEKEKIKDKQKEIKNQIDKLDKQCNCGSKSIVNDSVIVRTVILDGSKELLDLSSSIDQLVEEWKDLHRQLISKMIDIVTREKVLINKQTEINDYQKEANTYIPVSLIISVVGFMTWYEKTQSIQDKLLKEQYKEFISNEYCQSCGIYLNHQDFYSLLDKENKRKTRYCITCYQNGEFSEPDMTFEQMKKRVKERCLKLGFSKFQTYIYLLRLKNLFRWQKNFKW
jgi:hypothetical protein